MQDKLDPYRRWGALEVDTGEIRENLLYFLSFFFNFYLTFSLVFKISIYLCVCVCVCADGMYVELPRDARRRHSISKTRVTCNCELPGMGSGTWVL